MKHKREDKNVVINIMTAKTREEGEAWLLFSHEAVMKVTEPKLEYIHFLVATVNEHSVPETKLVLTPYTKPLASNPLEGAVPEHLKPTIEI